MPLSLAEANRAIDAALVKAGELEITSVLSATRLAPRDSIGKAIGQQLRGADDRKSGTNIVMGEEASLIMGPSWPRSTRQ